MQNSKDPGLQESEAVTVTSSASQDESTAVPKGNIQDFEQKAERWAQELIDNLNRNAKARVPTS